MEEDDYTYFSPLSQRRISVHQDLSSSPKRPSGGSRTDQLETEIERITKTFEETYVHSNQPPGVSHRSSPPPQRNATSTETRKHRKQNKTYQDDPPEDTNRASVSKNQSSLQKMKQHFLELEMNPDHLEWLILNSIKEHKVLMKFLNALVEKKKVVVQDPRLNIPKIPLSALQVEEDLLRSWMAYETFHKCREFSEDICDVDHDMKIIRNQIPYNTFFMFGLWKLEKSLESKVENSADVNAIRKCQLLLTKRDFSRYGGEELELTRAAIDCTREQRKISEEKLLNENEWFQAEVSRFELQVLMKIREKYGGRPSQKDGEEHEENHQETHKKSQRHRRMAEKRENRVLKQQRLKWKRLERSEGSSEERKKPTVASMLN